jgi:PAS domain S-box-containing protein
MPLLVTFITFLAAGVFLVDLLTPSGVAVGALYCGVALLSWWSPGRRLPILIASGCTVLLAIALFASRPGHDPWIDLTSRGLEVLSVWVVAGLVLVKKQAEAELTRAQARLEARVEERTSELAHSNERLEGELRERARVEAEHRKMEERFQAVAWATNDAIWDWDMISDTHWWGEGMLRLFGYDPEVVAGTSFSWWTDRVHPDDRDMILKSVEAAASRGDSAWSGEYRFRRENGTYALVFDRCLIRRNESGQPIRMIGAIVDITEQRRAQQLLHESREQYRQLFENNPLPSWVYDVETLQILDVNDAAVRQYGYAREEWLGMTIEDYRPHEDVRRLRDFLHTIRDVPEGICQGPWRHRKKDGTIVDVEIAFHALIYNGKAARLALVNDITERKQMEHMRSRLLHKIISAQEDERRRIARELHDEVGQSLTALLVGLRAMEQAMRRSPRDGETAELSKIAEQTLNDVQRLAVGLRPSVLDDVGLEAALTRYLEDFSRIHGIETDLKILSGRRLPYAVETTLYRLVQEALTNVAKHAGAQNASVMVVNTAESVQVIIEDDGHGFDVESMLKKQPDRHLGLHGMRERVALLDGNITIESKPGGGTSISVMIPMREADA